MYVTGDGRVRSPSIPALRALLPMPLAPPSSASRRDPLAPGALPPPPSPSVPVPLARRLGGWARRATWRVLHPDLREPYLSTLRLAPLERLRYRSCDGWQSVVHVLPPRPGGSGEPVLLAHALGLAPDAFRLDEHRSLAGALRRAGFAVYLMGHRGDRGSEPPRLGATFDFDDVLEQDVPAALRRILDHSRARRVHWVGHGIGGQLGLAFAGRGGSHQLASLTAMCAPVSFERRSTASEIRRARRVLDMLPSHWTLPASSVAWAAAPWVRDGRSLGASLAADAPGDLTRGLLCLGSQDVVVGLARQVGRWMSEGVWSDRTGLLDYAVSLGNARAPLLVIAAEDDPLCPPAHALDAIARWGGAEHSAVVLEVASHLDPLIGGVASEQVNRPVLSWLHAHRARSWGGVDPFQ